MDVCSAAAPSAEEEEQSAEERSGKVQCGIIKTFLGGLLSGLGFLSLYIDVEEKLEEQNPELAGRLREYDEKLAEYQRQTSQQLLAAGETGYRKLDALRTEAAARIGDYMASRGAAEEE